MQAFNKKLIFGYGYPLLNNLLLVLMDLSNRTGLSLFIRSILPSTSSIVGSIVVILILTGFHVLLLTNRPEVLLPKVAGESNDQMIQIYDKTVLAFINNFFGSSILGVLSTALVWGFAGWVVYSIIDLITNTYNEWRSSEVEINFESNKETIRKNLLDQLIIKILWRFLIGLLTIITFISMRGFVAELFNMNVVIIASNSLYYTILGIIVLFSGWMLLLHIYVIYFRLFLLRTRVFGEIIR